MFITLIAIIVRFTITWKTVARNGELDQVMTTSTVTANHDQIFFHTSSCTYTEQWVEHYRIWHQTPEGGQIFTPNTSDEDYADIAREDDADDPEPDMVLLPDDQDEFAAGAGDHVHSTPLNSPPHSPEVIEIVAVDENHPRQPPN